MGNSVKLSLLLSLAIFPLSAGAYTPFLSGSGQQIRWSNGTKFNLAGVAANQAGLTDGFVFSTIARALQNWQSVSPGAFLFDYWQGSDSRYYERKLDYDGLSAIHFASQGEGSGYGSQIIGLTQVWYDADTGEILEADIVLNDVDFQLTNQERDTTANGSIGKAKVFVGGVITHEIGHALGLSHSGVQTSTMLPVDANGQSHLSCDDQAAIRDVYSRSASQIQGSIVGPDGRAVFGANVVAVSLERGGAFASALSGKDGVFTIRGVEEGNYALMVEPYLSDAASLSSFYQGMNTAICSGRDFARTFLMGGDGKAQVLASAGVGRVDAGRIAVQCSSNGAASVKSSAVYPSQESSLVLSGLSGRPVAIADRFVGESVRRYDLVHPGGDLRLAVAAYGLFSPTNSSLNLLDSNGAIVSGDRIDDVMSGERDGEVNRDPQATYRQLAPGAYVVEVRMVSESVYVMPAGQMSGDTAYFFVLSARTSGAEPSGGVDCRLNESFPEYRSPGGNPPRNSDVGGSGCGKSAYASSGRPSAPLSTGMEALQGLLPGLLIWFGRRTLRS